MMPPCKRGCPDRSPTCHTTCEKYKEYRKRRDEALAKQHKDSDALRTVCEGMWRKSHYGPQI